MAGYSGTPLVKKLGLKPRSALYLHQPPERYLDWLHPMPAEVNIKSKLTGQLDFVHLFATRQKIFQREFLKARNSLRPDGMLWISWPKKSSKVATDLDENVIRDFGLENGMVDVKVCAIDEIWSGLKFVFRLKDRG
ncbi:MAG TPA: DUF3052 domain-containing protein [Cyclobacteriaceae bacterium]|nr:DUF3052 domain-containing protein [Cyclobacteriaceae bacterium]